MEVPWAKWRSTKVVEGSVNYAYTFIFGRVFESLIPFPAFWLHTSSNRELTNSTSYLYVVKLCLHCPSFYPREPHRSVILVHKQNPFSVFEQRYSVLWVFLFPSLLLYAVPFSYLC